jgi:hypothetical protein
MGVLPAGWDVEAIKRAVGHARTVKKLIIRGDPGIRRDARIEVDGEELVCFGIDRQGEFHGPDDVQLWCTVGRPDERETFYRREYVPHFLETVAIDAAAVTVISRAGQ